MKKKVLFILTIILAMTQSLLAQNIVITEISYNGPESGTDSTEFIELYNNSANAIDMTGYTFTSGVTYTFSSFMLNSGAVVVVAVDSVAIQNVFGVAALQWTSGGLSNSGEVIVLKDGLGVTVDSVNYDDSSPWPTGPPSPDGGGTTIELLNVSLDNNIGSNWTVSTTAVTGVIVNGNQVYGSPGVAPAMVAALTTSIVLDSNVTCNGLLNGGATVMATGGTTPYTYLWSNSATTASITGVSAAKYFVTVTDMSGTTAIDSVTITEPSSLTASTVVDSIVTCNGLFNGGATASATGGTMPYTYVWSNAATTASITGVSAGTYTVTINDMNGCADTSSAIITEPSPLIASTVVDSNVSVNGGSNGGATASATGGTMPYTYVWSNAATTASITGVSAGTYTVTINDLSGCIDTASVIIAQPTTIMLSTTVDSTVTCNGFLNGGASVSASGGTPPYTYAWSNSATTASITGLGAATYTVTVTDNSGSTSTSTAVITEPSLLVISTVVDSNVSVNGGSNGGATASATGGTMPYTYVWSNAATTASITGLVAGTYTATITDNNGCSDTASETITQPAAIMLSGVVTDISCNGSADGAIDLTVMNGTMPYSYLWSNTATTEDIGSLLTGTYSVTVTDALAATATASFTISQPTAITISTIIGDVTCNGFSDGTLTATAIGGTGTLNYAWSAGNRILAGQSFESTTTDNWNFTENPATYNTEGDSIVSGSDDVWAVIEEFTGNIDTASNGSYFWGAQDLENTNGGGAFYHTLTFDPINVSLETGVKLAFDYYSDGFDSTDSLEYQVKFDNGTNWDTNGTALNKSTLAWTSVELSVPDSANFVRIRIQVKQNGATDYAGIDNIRLFTSSNSVTGLTAGNYTVTVTDSLGCFTVVNATITEPTALSATFITTDASAVGATDGAIDLTVNGGVAPYSFSWSNSATTEDLVGLGAGTYTVAISDANGCALVDSATVNDPAQVVLLMDSSNISCFGAADGTAKVTASGGGTSYSYLWSNGATTDSIGGLTTGAYFVTVTDNVGTTAIDSVNILEPAQLQLSLAVMNASTTGATDGAIDLTVTGGTPGFTYTWSNGATTEDIATLAAGTYSVTVSDTNGCQNTSSAQVLAPGVLASLVISEINYNGPESGTDTSEYIEFVNVGMTTVNLNGYSFVEGVTHTFGINDSITAGQYFVIAVDSSAFRNRYGFNADAIWTSGGLSNGGEDITIVDNFGRTVDSVDFDDVTPWPSGALAGQPDGGGSSIELIDSSLNNNDGLNWIASTNLIVGQIVNGFQVYGTPGIGPILVGVSENNVVDSKLSIYPNPSRGMLTIETKTTDIINTRFQIMSIDGKVLRDEVMNQSKENIDISDFSNGVYFLRIGDTTQKIILSK